MSNSTRYHLERPRGNLMPKPTPPLKSPCMSFQMNTEHYIRTGEVIPVSEPKEFVMQENALDTAYNNLFGNPEQLSEAKEPTPAKHRGPKTIEMPPLKELSKDVKANLSTDEIAAKYTVSKSTAQKWIRECGLQRRPPGRKVKP